MAQLIMPENECCFPGGDGVDPLAVDRIVIAGDVCGDAPDSCEPGTSCKLAMIYFPSQQYRAGFEPAEALRNGTLYPELVSPYCGGNA